MTVRNRVEVMHGVNFDQLGRRDPDHYGDLTLDALERQIGEMGRDLGLETRFFQTNFEGEYVEHLHRLTGMSDAVVLNPGAWTHYSWAIHDALELSGLPAVEVHLSDVGRREKWRQVSVIADLCLTSISGRGVDGYRDALQWLQQVLSP